MNNDMSLYYKRNGEMVELCILHSDIRQGMVWVLPQQLRDDIYNNEGMSLNKMQAHMMAISLRMSAVFAMERDEALAVSCRSLAKELETVIERGDKVIIA